MYHRKKNVQTVDGTLLKLAAIDSLHVEPIGLLLRVLHVPIFFVSLMSVKRIAKLRKYEISFDNTNVFLYNKLNGWNIGLAKVQHSLYYLSKPIQGARRPSTAQITAVTSSNEDEKAMLIQKRLGHPSFHLLETMYPHYFKIYQLLR